MSKSDLGLPIGFIFDWDSTLVDNWTCIARSLNATLKQMGKAEWNEDEIRNNTKKSARDAFPDLFGENWEEALDFFYKSFEKFHLEELKPLYGAENLLKTINGLNIFVGIISNKNGNYLRKEIRTLGWMPYFKRIIGATDVATDKPSPKTVLSLLNRTKIEPCNKVWFVGDTMVDLKCAHLSGCLPILVKTGSITAAELKAWPPAKTYSSCAELDAELKKLII